jgi:glutamyl-tRNA reductase
VTSLYAGHLEQFVVIGTNFTKADTQTRSRFAVPKSVADEVYENVSKKDFSDFFLLSTCNRTEFYGSGNRQILKKQIIQQLKLSDEEFAAYFYVHSGMDAVRHFFKVVSGLDSQIIGDYEIVCQVKAALAESRKHGMVGTLTDRISNFAFQASKKIKAHTNLSSGKYSVSYAAAELMFHQKETQPVESILLIGTGDFGSTVARNLRHYFPKVSMYLTNRTAEKAEKLAAQINGKTVPFSSFKEKIHEVDAVITTVGLDHYLINTDDIINGENKLLLDLSVPQAIDPAVKAISGIRLYSVDEISAFHNELLKQRQVEVPRAEKIMDVFIDRLLEWYQVYNHRDIILSYKEKIQNLVYDYQATKDDIASIDKSKKIEKTFSGLIQRIKTQGYAGCMIIETMNDLVPAER